MDLLVMRHNNFKYLLVVVDDFTKYVWVFGIKNETCVLQHVKDIDAVIKRNRGHGIRRIRADEGTEFKPSICKRLASSSSLLLLVTVMVYPL